MISRIMYKYLKLKKPNFIKLIIFYQLIKNMWCVTNIFLIIYIPNYILFGMFLLISYSKNT